jgi:hypothetical protein
MLRIPRHAVSGVRARANRGQVHAPPVPPETTYFRGVLFENVY